MFLFSCRSYSGAAGGNGASWWQDAGSSAARAGDRTVWPCLLSCECVVGFTTQMHNTNGPLGTRISSFCARSTIWIVACLKRWEEQKDNVFWVYELIYVFVWGLYKILIVSNMSQKLWSELLKNYLEQLAPFALVCSACRRGAVGTRSLLCSWVGECGVGCEEHKVVLKEEHCGFGEEAWTWKAK